MSVWKKIASSLILVLLVMLGSSTIATALQSSSAHYGIDESQFGSGGLICDPGTNGSAHYCATQTLGETGVGNSASANYRIQAGGTVTDRETSLTLIVNNTNIDVGVLTSSSTHVATATFSVFSYLADGYAVYTDSPGPQNGSHILHTLSSATAPSVGTEQFGINLVANSCPASAPASGAGSCSGSFGAVPLQVPDNTFSFGTARSGYNTAGNYKYVNGDEVASSSSSSGETDYTMSYIFNISAVTPGGVYTMNQSIVATSTF
jgi:hypothetical protein